MTLRSVPGSVFPVGEPSPASARHFSGEVYLKLLIDEGITVKNVTFSPGCRNHWHIHHNGGQFLLVTSGHGWYQAWGRPARELHPGDVVCIQGEEKHWHGAAQDSWFQHLCIDIPAPAGHIEWLEPVEGGRMGPMPERRILDRGVLRLYNAEQESGRARRRRRPCCPGITECTGEPADRLRGSWSAPTR